MTYSIIVCLQVLSIYNMHINLHACAYVYASIHVPKKHGPIWVEEQNIVCIPRRVRGKFVYMSR